MGKLKSLATAQPPASSNLPSFILDTPRLDDTPRRSMLDMLDRVLAAIEHFWASMEAKHGSLAADFASLQDDHRKLVDRVSDGEKTLFIIQPEQNIWKGTPAGATSIFWGSWRE
ncbi:hypothetical protein NDU88_002654 [Pleurodeles waltl]|uniref:Uncharacterized protein n=1 Tax=Pleurodeles waltl TaxID=8319 RepID=A0AAV7M174_PLEWA|nr:hypothetical protein NDU88_002654 [Pleurodeles waltl]